MRRISIRTTMAFVLVVAVGLAALRNANDLWAGSMLLAAMAATGAAILGAILSRGRERAWWLGFALFGGGYLAAAFGSIRSELATTVALRYVHSQVTDQSTQNVVMNRLISLRQSLFSVKTKIRDAGAATSVPSASNDPATAGLIEKQAALRRRIAGLESKMQALRSVNSADSGIVDPEVDGEIPAINHWRALLPGAANLAEFERVGHAVFALLGGLAGGTVAVWFWQRRSRQESEAAG
jgi:hypothetical protein